MIRDGHENAMTAGLDLVAARLAAETIAAQQAEIRRLESALHNAEHELLKANAKLAELTGPPSWKRMDRIQRPETYR
jgi:peptidoglycan hydrolase CwlO-like protein